MMRSDNLLEIQDREVPRATGVDGGPEIYLNLARRVKVRGPDQVWIADITYIRLKSSFRLTQTSQNAKICDADRQPEDG